VHLKENRTMKMKQTNIQQEEAASYSPPPSNVFSGSGVNSVQTECNVSFVNLDFHNIV
jgi:hypothetical protein